MSDDQRPNSQNMLIQECLSRFRQRLEYVLNNDPLDLDYLAYIVTQEKTFMNALENVDQPIDVFEAMELSNLLDQRHKPPIFNSVVKMIGHRGRFRLHVTEEHLQNLLELGLPATCVADLLGVS
ncbi:hypothetical protein ILYODFUR_033301 [Ilyodon furcidens]|uniref:Uncharacterized protein n=1 Tax=Ilyodon furcidens TaxID=33524 RepID=A0ABV0SSB1_9TELE